MVKRGNNALVQVKVRWRHDGTATAWEDCDTLRHCFPHAPAWDTQVTDEADQHAATEDGARSEEEGNVTSASPGGDAVDA